MQWLANLTCDLITVGWAGVQTHPGPPFVSMGKKTSPILPCVPRNRQTRNKPIHPTHNVPRPTSDCRPSWSVCPSSLVHAFSGALYPSITPPLCKNSIFIMLYRVYVKKTDKTFFVYCNSNHHSLTKFVINNTGLVLSLAVKANNDCYIIWAMSCDF